MNKGRKANMAVPPRGHFWAEMLMDRIAASKVYRGSQYTDADPLEYFLAAKEPPIMHENTRELLLKLLTMLAQEGEERTFRYVRISLLGKKR